ncbi:MAG: hypothetical protein FWG83_03230 [Oscillospiraceae bacterium]|nr:hypothetical protein [Oscillospiraceae bacterium]
MKCGENIADVPENAPHINICTNSECDYHKTKFIYPDDARFCDICGKPTVYAG